MKKIDEIKRSQNQNNILCAHCYCVFLTQQTLWCTPKLSVNSNVSLKVKTTKGMGIHSLACNTLGGRGVCWSSEMGTRTNDKRVNYSHNQTNQTTNWLMHNWNTFGAWTSHEHTQIHKTHHGSNLGEAITFPLIYFLWLIMGLHPNVILSCDSQVGSPEIFKIETFNILKGHNFLCRPPIEVRSKAKL